MTVQSYYYKKPVSNTFSVPTLKFNNSFSIKKIKRQGLNYFSDIFKNNNSGKAKIGLVLGVSLFGMALIGYMCAQSSLTNLDYRITDIKTNINKIEKENSDLKEKLTVNISPEAIITWAENNGYVKNDTISYFQLKGTNLVLNQNNF